jgi:multidrug efflux pump subunit AcrB
VGIVKFALRFPHTFYVVAVLILFLGMSAIVTTPTDIFPQIRIPVVSVIWQYTGLSPSEMEARVATYGEYTISTNVNGIKNMESQTLSGIVVQKIYFQPNVNIDLAITQIVAATNAIRSILPPGIQPPVIVQYNASSVPILQLSLSSDTLNEQQLYDYGIYQVRQQLVPIPGVTLPTPYGGKYRQIMVDLDPAALLARGLTPTDVLNAVSAQNLTVPSGDAKIGSRQYIVQINGQSPSVAALNDIPVRQANGATVYLRDVAHVRDGWSVQQNVVRTGGKRSVLLTVIKNGEASTLDVVRGVKAALPGIRATAPPGVQITELFDQSVFVRNSIDAVLREGAIAAGLTALMILIFLGSWRSTIVVMVSIPLSILTSIAILSALGESINTMTLGGLALAVGILVDDSTVTIENTHRLLDEGMPFDRGVLYGAAGIAVPTLVSTLAISCVFISVLFLDGAPFYLFAPQGLAVVFAMLASYGLSRTLTPIIIRLLVRREHDMKAHENEATLNRFQRIHHRFNHYFEEMRTLYVWVLEQALAKRTLVPIVVGSVTLVTICLTPFVGRDFFPHVDAGLIQLHVRAPARTRIEDTERTFQAVENHIRDVIPADERDLIIDNIGLPARTYNLAFTDGTAIGVNDGIIQVALKPGHAPTEDYIKRLRADLPQLFPETMFYFQPADMVTQILNFGVPTQVDVQVAGRNRAENLKIAQELRRRIAGVPGAVDVHLQQEVDAPELYYKIDRTRAQELNQTISTISNNLMISLSSSSQVFPNFWTDPVAGIPYFLAVQTPEYRVASLNDLNNTSIASTSGTGAPIPNTLGNVATMERRSIQSVINHSNVAPVFDVYASVQDRDLGGVGADIGRIVKDMTPGLPRGSSILVHGQIDSMNSAFARLALGLIFAAVFVYLLMVVNFQNFLDPFVVILALPGAACGIIFLLFVTGTTLSVPSLMGAIMAIGVASANSILLVTFAREQSLEGKTPLEAAIAAGATRLRPVLMTAAAMIVGMLPMAIGGAGEEQNAVLARSVIGGLLFGTCTTLLVVPYLYAMLRLWVGEHKRIEPDFGENEGHPA